MENAQKQIPTQTTENKTTPTPVLTEIANVATKVIDITPLERKATLLEQLAKYSDNKLEKAEALKLLGDVRYQQSRENNYNTRLRDLAKNCYMAARNLELAYRTA